MIFSAPTSFKFTFDCQAACLINDSARKFSGDGSAARAAGSPSTDVDMQKLKRMMQNRAELFSVLNAIMTKYDQSAKNVIQSMRG